MRVKASEIKQMINEVWPELEYIWIFDSDWWIPSLEQVQNLMNNSRVSSMKFIPEFWDCDNFAKQFDAEIERKRYFSHMDKPFPDEQLAEVSIYKCAGLMFRGISKNHVCNLGVLREGVYLIDMTPGEQRIWKADPEQDDIYFITSL